MESQWALKKIGYKINITGKLDGPTSSALKAFQKEYGLLGAGKITQKTHKLLQQKANSATEDVYAE